MSAQKIRDRSVYTRDEMLEFKLLHLGQAALRNVQARNRRGWVGLHRLGDRPAIFPSSFSNRWEETDSWVLFVLLQHHGDDHEIWSAAVVNRSDELPLEITASILLFVKQENGNQRKLGIPIICRNGDAFENLVREVDCCNLNSNPMCEGSPRLWSLLAN